MEEPEVQTNKKKYKIVIWIITTVMLPVIGYLAIFLIQSTLQLSKDMSAVQTEITTLKEDSDSDKAMWATLSEHRKSLAAMETKLAVMKSLTKNIDSNRNINVTISGLKGNDFTAFPLVTPDNALMPSPEAQGPIGDEFPEGLIEKLEDFNMIQQESEIDFRQRTMMEYEQKN
jgi:hypothetical protein